MLKHPVNMANRDPSDDAQEAKVSPSPRAADATAQPGDKISSSVQEVVPLFDIINTCLEELPALQGFMPPRCARACLMSDGVDIVIGHPFSTEMQDALNGLTRTAHAVLIIEDIDAWWSQALITQFPASLDVRFLAQHIIRLGNLGTRYDLRNFQYEEYGMLVSRVDAEISRRLSRATVNRDLYCRHVDGHVARYGIDTGTIQMTARGKYGYRWERFDKCATRPTGPVSVC